MKKFSFVLSVVALLYGLNSCSDDSLDVTDNNEEPKAVDKTANLQGTGDSANDLLSNDRFNKLKIEIAYVEGFQPTQEAIDGFIDY